jgi:hypothetical protein
LTSVGSNVDWAGIVLWDAAPRGDQYVAGLRAAQRRYQRAASAGIGWPRFRFFEHELLGTTFKRATLRELSGLRLPPAEACAAPVRVLNTASPWHDLAHLEDMLPDVGISPALTRLVRELS